MKTKLIWSWQKSQTADQLKSCIKQECENNMLRIILVFYIYLGLIYFFHYHHIPVLTMVEDGPCSTMVSGSWLLSILSWSWWSRAKPAAMSLGTRSVSWKRDLQLCNSYVLYLFYIFSDAFIDLIHFNPLHQLLKPWEKVILTEKNLLKSWAMLENAARWLSSCGRQQHIRRSLLSHTFTAKERAVEKNWEAWLLSISCTPSGSMAGGGRRESPSGSNTNITPNPVISRMIQLLWEQKWKCSDKITH